MAISHSSYRDDTDGFIHYFGIVIAYPCCAAIANDGFFAELTGFVREAA
jgi:hypothetical protein